MRIRIRIISIISINLAIISISIIISIIVSIIILILIPIIIDIIMSITMPSRMNLAARTCLYRVVFV